jgi:hypothetical protein
VRVARFACTATALLALASASAGAGANAARPPVALTASPAHVELSGAARATVKVTNAGSKRVVVDMSRAGFALDLRGRPRIVAANRVRRSAAGWLSFRPRAIALRPGASRSVTIASTPPASAEPGDHDALVLLTTRRLVRDRVAVRMRMGVVVVVRVPGTIRRRLELRAVRVAGSGRVRELEVVVVNLGNVTESFLRKRSVVSLHRSGRRTARLTAETRNLRPGTVGVLRFRYSRRLAGPTIARVDVTTESGRVIRRTLRIRL